MNKPFLTVFTPTYNRAHTLPRLYESLKGQSNTDFLWLIVDDGSTDNTSALVETWQREGSSFAIRYLYQENGGMHTAHNLAYAAIDTELNMCIDSDDALAPGAVQIIFDAWAQVRDRGYTGLLALDADFDGNIIGRGFPKGLTETTLGGYYRNGGRGDKKLILRTDVVRCYPPYPTFPGEKFVPLGSLYTMIDRDYQLSVLDEVICHVEYQSDGATRSVLREYHRSPRGFRYGRLVALFAPMTAKQKCKTYIHYCAESILAGEPILADAPEKLPALLTLPIGAALTAWIRYHANKEQRP